MKTIIGMLSIMITVISTFGQGSSDTYSIQLLKLGNLPSIMSEEFVNNPNPLADMLTSPEVTIQPCGVFDINVGSTAVFTKSFENKQSSFLMKLIDADSNKATIEFMWSHQYSNDMTNVSMTDERSVSARTYIVHSRKPSTVTSSFGHWMTIAGDPLKNTERLIIRIIK